MNQDEKIRVYLAGLAEELNLAVDSFTARLKNKLHAFSDELDLVCGVAANLQSLANDWHNDFFINDPEFSNYSDSVKARRALQSLNLEGVDLD